MGSPLWLRGLRSRLLVNLLLLTLAATAVATAVLGPLLIRGVEQFTLQSALAAGPVDQTSVRVSQFVDGDSPDPMTGYRTASSSVAVLVREALDRTGSTAWQPSVVDAVSGSNLAWTTASRPGAGPAAPAEVSSRVVAVEDCAPYALTAGRCPADLGEVLVSRPDAERAGQALALGRTITSARTESDPGTTLRVVGAYDPVGSDHGQLVRPGTLDGELARVSAEPLIMTADQAAALLLPATVSAQLTVSPTVAADDVAGLRATVEAIGSGAGRLKDITAVDSELPTLLDRVERQARAAALLLGVTVAQAVLLTLFATATVLQRVARTRAPEWGIGRLRGVPRPRWLASVYTEPALVLLAGLPLGYALGVAVARVAVSRNLDPGTPVEPLRWPVLAVAALAALGAVVALIGVSVRSVRRPLPELISSATEPRRLTLLGALGQLVVVLLAGVSLYQLLVGGVLARERSLLGLLAPALFALALAVVAVRTAVLVVRQVTGRPPRSLTALVVGRQAARTPSSLNPAMVVAAGMALAVFATQVVVLADRNADLRAAAVVGADEVLGVSVPPGTDLVAAVREADPDGQWAMAAAERVESAGTGRIVAVDTLRLDRVSAWSPRWAGVADPAAALRPAVGPALRLRGRTLTVTLSEVKVRSLAQYVDEGTGYGTGLAPRVQVTVDTGREWQTVTLGPLGRGSATLRAAIPCRDTCRLVSLGVAEAFPTPYTADLVVTTLATDQQPASELADWLQEPDRWRAVIGEQVGFDPSNSATALPAADGLALSVIDYTGRQATRVAPTDTVEPAAVLVGPKVLLAPLPGQPDVTNGSGLDGRAQQLRVVGRTAVLPRTLDDGVLTDLANARGLVDPATVDAVAQVWLRAGAPPEVEQRLDRAGIRVQSRATRADKAAELRREGVPRAAVLSVWVGGLALLLTVLALVAARVADAGRRRRDWLALRQAGLGPRTLRRLAFVEVAGPALLGVATGLAAGLGAMVLAAGRLPLTDLEAFGPPLDLRLGWLPAAGLAGLAVVVVVLVAGVAAVAETRSGNTR